MALRIEDYAMIGDCETAALVGRDGSIDWLCWPRFDSAACFAALLGTSDNGRWLLAPKSQPLEVTRRYRPGTLILETEFRTETGTAVVIDFMPPADGVADLVRIVCGLSGQVTFQTELAVRFDYGSTVPWVTRIEDGTIEMIAGPEQMVLRTAAELYGEDLKIVGEFVVDAGPASRLGCRNVDRSQYPVARLRWYGSKCAAAISPISIRRRSRSYRSRSGVCRSPPGPNPFMKPPRLSDK
jgi:hypothetical protein